MICQRCKVESGKGAFVTSRAASIAWDDPAPSVFIGTECLTDEEREECAASELAGRPWSIPHPPFKRINATGEPASEMILKDRGL